MSNDYFEHPEVFIPGDLARAEDVENEFKRVESGFEKLPEPRPGGDGFSSPVYVGQATNDGHAANWGQLKELEEQAEAHAAAADTARLSAETAEDGAETAQSAAEAAQTGAETAESNADGHAATALGHANTAGASATLASQWAVKIDAPVSGSDYGAKYYSTLSKSWASGAGEIEPGLKSAKGYAEEAAAIVAGARTYIGLHDASGGSYPIATPQAGDAGKYWVIQVAGTLPLGAVDVGWELSINDSLAYEAANLLPGNLITQVNGQVGPTVTLTESDIPDIASTYLAAASYTASDVLSKLLTVDGSGSGLDADTLDGFQATYFLPSANYTAADVLAKIKTVDGAGSGLDADRLDGQQASAFFPASGVSAFGASLVDDASASAARTTLGLGSAATQNTGSGAGTVPIRDGSGNVPGSITGNAATANRLTNARTLTLTGDVQASLSFDGSGNVSGAATVTDDSHAHSTVANYGNYTAPFNNAANNPRTFHSAGLCRAFVRASDGWPVANATVLNVPSYTTSQDGGAMQILTPYQAGQTTNNNILWRVGLYNNAGWTSWKSALDKDFADSLYLATNATATAASKLANARTISLTGDATGSTTFDGSANRSISVNLQAANLLTKLRTVDGAGSLLDADRLDGQHASAFPLKTNNLSDLASVSSARSNLDVYSKGEADGRYLNEANNLSDLPNMASARNFLDVYSKTETNNRYLLQTSDLSDVANASTARFNLGLGSAAVRNEGAGNGLDADLLDGQHASAFPLKANNLSDLASASTARNNLGLGSAAVRNEGAGNGLDADLLDGLHGSSYLKKSEFNPDTEVQLFSGVSATAVVGVSWSGMYGIQLTSTHEVTMLVHSDRRCHTTYFTATPNSNYADFRRVSWNPFNAGGPAFEVQEYRLNLSAGTVAETGTFISRVFYYGGL